MLYCFEPSFTDYVSLCYWEYANIRKSNVSAGNIEIEFIIRTNNDSAITQFGHNAFVHLAANQDLVPEDIPVDTLMAKITNFSMTIEKL
jgi:hypothetical protein